MQVWVEFRPYRRPFKTPLQTAHGLWRVRQGIWLKLRDRAGRTGFGELAPIPWFGSESLESAIATCEALVGWQDATRLQTIPADSPACQFGFGTALADLETPFPQPEIQPEAICGLLTAGAAALQQWQPLWQQGHRTFKWKIGVYGIEAELVWLQALATTLPPEGRLRLDANGGLTETETQRWLETCASLSAEKIEFLEQPLPPTQFDALLRLSQAYPTPLALDESVATLTQLQDCHRRGWSGIYVVKPALCGYFDQVARVLQTLGLDTVLSSALETGLGRRRALALATPGPGPLMGTQGDTCTPLTTRALGFGTGNLFDDDWDRRPAEQLWNTM